MSGVYSNPVSGVLAATLASPSAKPKKHGGRRAGAGRKRHTKDAPHTKRAPLSSQHPVHVTLRTLKGVPRLRQARVHKAMKRTLVRYLGRDDFRIVHISVQANHIHLLVEASSRSALTRGMQSFAINAARGINGACRRTGKVFAFRYGAKQVKTALYARNVLSYILNNWRRHREDLHEGGSLIIDKFSSAVSFGGWSIKILELPRLYEPLPVSPPKTGLLDGTWELYGLISPFERPASIA